MVQEQFLAIMPYISADLVGMIAKKQGISETEALEKLYSSKLYELLEKEETKIWHTVRICFIPFSKRKKKRESLSSPMFKEAQHEQGNGICVFLH